MGNCIGIGVKKKKLTKDVHDKQKPVSRVHKWLEENEKYAMDRASQMHYSVEELSQSHSNVAVGKNESSRSNNSIPPNITTSTVAGSPNRTARSEKLLPPTGSPSHRTVDRLLRDERQSLYFTASESVSEGSESRNDLDRSKRNLNSSNPEGEGSLRILHEEEIEGTEVDGYLTTDEGDTLSPMVQRRETVEEEEIVIHPASQDGLYSSGRAIPSLFEDPEVEEDIFTPEHTDVSCNGDPDQSLLSMEEDSQEKIREAETRRLPYDKRPLRPMPTPIRNCTLSPRTMERVVDDNGRVRMQNTRVLEFIEKKRVVKPS